jgi:hypothetical protein
VARVDCKVEENWESSGNLGPGQAWRHVNHVQTIVLLQHSVLGTPYLPYLRLEARFLMISGVGGAEELL